MKVVFSVSENPHEHFGNMVPYRLFLPLSPKRLSAAAYNDFEITSC